MRIFITGGTGFIGRYVVERLTEEGNHLLLLSNKEKTPINIFSERFKDNEVVFGNLSDISNWEKSLRDFKPDLAIHMAWQGIPDYKSEMSVINLRYGLNLYLTLAKIGCKRILTSGSCWEYGITEGKLSEEISPHPSNPFTVAKNSLHMMGKEIAKENEMQFIWTRFFYVYGPRQKTSSLLPYIVNSVLDSEKPQIKTPESKNDFVFAEDVADALSMIITKGKRDHAIYNIGSGYSTSVREIIEIAYKKNQIPLPSDLFPQTQNTDQIVDFWADISKIKTEIGWKPKVSITEGIEKTLNYYRLRKNDR